VTVQIYLGRVCPSPNLGNHSVILVEQPLSEDSARFNGFCREQLQAGHFRIENTGNPLGELFKFRNVALN
jgi:hypothetical protein